MFESDGVMYQFNPQGFKDAITKYQVILKEEGKPYLLKDISDSVASELNISVEALNNWRKGYNGPSDIERIKEIAAVLKCDYKGLLVSQGGQKHMISKDVSTEVYTTEKEVLRSIIGDFLEIVEFFGKTKGFTDCIIRNAGNPDENEEIDFEGWLDKVRLKIRKNEFFISKQNIEKIERLYMETHAFVSYSITHSCILRWMKICKGFELERNIDEIADSLLDIDELIESGEYVDEDMSKYLIKELEDYIQGGPCFDCAIDVIGYRVGLWYMEIVRNDFPELFVD